MKWRRPRLLSESRGQSLVETAIALPLLALLVLNVVNLGYFFLVMINLTGAARSAALYSIEGTYTPYAQQQPSSGGNNPTTAQGTVAYTAYQDLTGAVWNPTVAQVQVCTQSNVNGFGFGVNGFGAGQRANCETCASSGCTKPGGGNPQPSADPEAPDFVLNEIDIQYKFNTLVPGTIFNLPLQASPMCNAGSCTFTRLARMRSMGP